MKIDNTQTNVVGLPLNDNRGKGKNLAGESAAVQDKVSLSDLTTRIRQPGNQADGANGINLDRVNAIRQAIETAVIKSAARALRPACWIRYRALTKP